MLMAFRITGYAVCTGIGFFMSLLGTLILFGGTNSSNLSLFAVLYVLGNIIGKLLCFFFANSLDIFIS